MFLRAPLVWNYVHMIWLGLMASSRTALSPAFYTTIYDSICLSGSTFLSSSTLCAWTARSWMVRHVHQQQFERTPSASTTMQYDAIVSRALSRTGAFRATDTCRINNAAPLIQRRDMTRNPRAAEPLPITELSFHLWWSRSDRDPTWVPEP
ncbi:hypothetical protein F5Y15DRAFT_333928 [Xylariaceae sp. FL0016]|nr:hypothetical protein F5Y15DRAFT_333928 [Xylariaceae sp. FL0016]